MFLGVRARALGLALLVPLVFATGVASANGRFPSAQQLIVHPNDPNRVWLRATYGILTSGDRGASWHWVCEQSVGYRGTEDPAIAIASTGRFMAAFFDGLSTTTDNGCDFSMEQSIGQQNVVDISVDKVDPTRVLAITSTGDGSGYFINEVWRSSDSGASWTRVGDRVDKTFLALTIDSAPSDPKTIYMTGAIFLPSDGGTELPTKGVLLRSTDSGLTWKSIDLVGTDNQNQPYLSAVDPKDPKKLFIRVRGPDISTPADPGQFVESRLLYSENGGDSFREVFRGNADFLGFALAPDGQTVLLGLGDAKALGGARPGDETQFGLYRATLPALNFQRVGHMNNVPVGHIGCLTYDHDTLWVCTSEFKQGFELARSSDGGLTLESVMHLKDLAGPVQCGCDTTTGANCPAAWQPVCENISRCEFGTPDPNLQQCTGDGGSSGGAGGRGGGTGSGGSGLGGAGASGGSAGTTNPAAGSGGSDSSCGCRVPPEGASGAGVFVALSAALGSLLLLSRRRR